MARQKQKAKIPKKTPLRRWALAGLAVLLIAVGASAIITNFWLRAPNLPSPPLKQLAAAHGVQLGVLTHPHDLDHQPFTDVLTSQYSMLTSDRNLHWDKLRPSPTEYDWTSLDRLVDFAAQNNLTVQGHHLIWDEDDSLPEWLKDGQYSKDQVLSYMHEHISTVVGRYKGRIQEWSVVNEPFTRARHVYGLDSWWYDATGRNTDYIDQAFVAARTADPQAKLILNDFNNEVQNEISDAQYAYMKQAKARGIPIDGIGMQIHVDASQPPSKEAMAANMRRFADLGYSTYITEFDISSVTVEGDAQYKAQLEAQITADVVRACVESQSCVSFTVFGMTDIRNMFSFTHRRERSNLLTTRYQPKPAFYAFREAWQ